MKHRYLKNVATLRISPDKCSGCGKCLEVCPHRVLKLENRKIKIIDKNSCIECGACSKNCPLSAIKVDAGVGCALAVIMGWFTGKEPSCDGSAESCC
jgi:NAD-dependent dihydropyrimidine dehydrogenase PreA subunit